MQAAIPSFRAARETVGAPSTVALSHIVTRAACLTLWLTVLMAVGAQDVRAADYRGVGVRQRQRRPLGNR